MPAPTATPSSAAATGSNAVPVSPPGPVTVNLPGGSGSRAQIAPWRRHEILTGRAFETESMLFTPAPAHSHSDSDDLDGPRRAPAATSSAARKPSNASLADRFSGGGTGAPTASSISLPRKAFDVPTYLQYSVFQSRMFTYPHPSSSSPLVERDGDGAAGSSTSPRRRRTSSTPTVMASFKPKSLLAASLNATGAAQAASDDWTGASRRCGTLRLTSTVGLPTHWDTDDRCPLVEISSDGLGVAFCGPSRSHVRSDRLGSGKNGDRDAAAVRANRPMPSSCGIYYFEVEIVSKGQSGYIGVGFSALNVILSRLPGWEQASWGYHGDDGNSFASQGTGRTYGPTFTTGDIVGCGLDFSCGRAFFTKNGVQLGHVFDNLPFHSTQLYPSVGLRTPGEIVRGNFGQRPFRYDIDHFVRLRRDEIRQSMMASTISERYLLKPSASAPVPDEPRWPEGAAEPDVEADTLVRDTAAELIASYLSYHGHVETARAFERQRADERRARSQNLGFGPLASGGTETPVASTSTGGAADSGLGASDRQRTCAAILGGDAAGALLTIRKRYPKALPAIERAMRRHIFVELVVALASNDGDAMDEDGSAGSDDDARAAMLEYGRSLDAAYGSTDPDLRATFGLLACVDPVRERPDLAGDEARRKLAEQVNAAILSACAFVERPDTAASQGQSARPPLELAYRQAAASMSTLGRLGVGQAVLVSLTDVLRRA